MADIRTPVGLSEKGQEYYKYYYNMFLSNPSGMSNFTMPDDSEARVAAQRAAEQIIQDNPIYTRPYSYQGKEYQIPVDSKTTGNNGQVSAVNAAKLFLRKLNTHISREQEAAGKTAQQLGNGKVDKSAIKEDSTKQYWGTTSSIPSAEAMLNDPSVAGQTLTMLYNQKIAAGNNPEQLAKIEASTKQTQQLLRSKMDSDPTFRAVAMYVYYSGVKFHSAEEEAAKEKCLKAYKSIYDKWIASKKPMLSDGVKETNKKAQEATTNTYEQQTPQTYK